MALIYVDDIYVDTNTKHYLDFIKFLDFCFASTLAICTDWGLTIEPCRRTLMSNDAMHPKMIHRQVSC